MLSFLINCYPLFALRGLVRGFGCHVCQDCGLTACVQCVEVLALYRSCVANSGWGSKELAEHCTSHCYLSMCFTGVCAVVGGQSEEPWPMAQWILPPTQQGSKAHVGDVGAGHWCSHCVT